MIHSVIDTVSTESEVELIEGIALKMPHAPTIALKQLDFQWKTEGEGLSTTGAHFLWWHYKDLGLCDRRKIGSSSKRAKDKHEYRLTPFGLKVRKALVLQGSS